MVKVVEEQHNVLICGKVKSLDVLGKRILGYKGTPFGTMMVASVAWYPWVLQIHG